MRACDVSFIFLYLTYQMSNSMVVDKGTCKVLEHGSFTADEYRPGGCSLHKYTSREVRSCFAKHHKVHGSNKTLLAMIGDSRIRQPYRYLISMIREEKYIYKTIQKDFIYPGSSDSPVSMEFFWKPREQVEAFVDQWNETYKYGSPIFAVMAVALHYIDPKAKNINKKVTEAHYREYKGLLTRLLPKLAKVPDTKIIWMLQDPGSPELRKITQEAILRYNQLTIEMLHTYGVTAWLSCLDIANMYGNKTDRPNSLHSGPSILSWDSQILMNLVCNAYIKPNDTNCCKQPEHLVSGSSTTERPAVFYTQSIPHLQNTMDLLYPCAIVFIISIITAKLRELLKQTSKDETSKEAKPEKQINILVESTWLFVKYGVILMYFYLCDRVDVFSIDEKQYAPHYFCTCLAVFLIVGLLSIRKIDKDSILNRHQTDEWKGWMQLVILVYHYTGTSQNLQIYMYIRVLVSAYLFMTGFGHVIHGLKYRDLPIMQLTKRICEVLFRMNFLTVSLCFVMGKPYQFYYFVPLVSFCFLCVVAITWVPILVLRYCKLDNISTLYGGVFFSAVVLILINTILNKYQVLFQCIYSVPVVSNLFKREDGSLNEWFFRWSIDRYSSISGAIVGITLTVLDKFESDVEQPGRYVMYRNLVLIPLCSVGIITYMAAGEVCKTKEECNSLHAYLSVVPILSFLVLRNLHSKIRKYYCSVFSWTGKISLELFISQYHIWLANDTKALLVIIPGIPILNVTLTSLILVCVAHEIKDITNAAVKIIFH